MSMSSAAAGSTCAIPFGSGAGSFTGFAGLLGGRDDVRDRGGAALRAGERLPRIEALMCARVLGSSPHPVIRYWMAMPINVDVTQ